MSAVLPPDDTAWKAPRILTVQEVAWPHTTVVRLGSGKGARLRRTMALLRLARKADIVLLSRSGRRAQWYDQRLLAGFIARTVPNAIIVLDDWEEGGQPPGRRFLKRRPVGWDRPARLGGVLDRVGARWLNSDRIYYVLYSRGEAELFAARWGIDERRTRFLMYHAHPWTEAPHEFAPRQQSDLVFAGGDALRDYRALIAAGDDIPATVRVATTLPLGPMPENITGGALSQGEYERYAREAVIHVVAAVKDAPRSTGQAAYLDALMLGRPVVVTDGLGVRDHLRDGIDAVIVQPDDPPALASAINRLLRSEGLRRQIGSEGARRARELFTMEAFRARQYAQLLEIWNLRRAARDGERSGTLQT